MAKSLKNVNSVEQEQIHDLLFSREIGWQEIIHDLINTEQLDPWNIDIVILSSKYLEQVHKFEEADFFVSSKVLLAAALLLRIKSEILLNQYIKSIDDILFGKKQETPVNKVLERFELPDDLPELVPRSPLPRFRKVTLKELLESLGKAIATENRRIKKEIIKKNVLREISFSIPKKRFNIKNKIKEIYDNLLAHFKEPKNQNTHKVSFKEFIGQDKDERIIAFSPLLHLDHQKKVWLEQDEHLEDFHIWLSHVYKEHNPDPFSDLRHEMEEKLEELDDEKKQRLKEINEDFENPLGELFD